jgi:ABC-2 type transport system ATP-binding protein
MANEAIVCRGLTKRYGDRLALSSVDLTINQGEVFGLVGPNGAGKTTLLKMLLALVHPTAGEIFLFGLKSPCPDVLRETGAMVEKPSFYPWLTGRANLQVFLDSGPPGSDGAVERALSRVGLTEAGGRPAKTYSQGMRQRLGMATALLRDPKLLVLDEPTNGLDPVGIRDFRDLVIELSSAGVTVLLSSHLLSEVERICTRVALISGGQLTGIRTIGQAATTSRLRVTIAVAQQADAQSALADYHPLLLGPGVLRIEGETGQKIAEILASRGIFASAMEPERDSLEDIYLSVVDSEAANQ